MIAGVAFASVMELAACLRHGEFSVPELVEFFLDRAERLNGQSHAFITLADERAREHARQVARDPSHNTSPLAGIPYACKDLIEVAGMVTTGGSRVLADNVAVADAHLVECMEAQGAIMIGKTNLHEFAFGATGENRVYGTPVNAYDPSRLACGSSSGSAAAVAHGLCPAAFGTDTGGSVRVPAVVNGLVGLKPTQGLVSTRGVVPYCWSLDHIGTITRTVADAALLLECVSVSDRAGNLTGAHGSADYRDSVTRGRIRGLRIGVPRGFFFERACAEALACTERVLEFLELAGAEPVEVELPSMEHARTVSLTVQMPEALSYHGQWLEERGNSYGEDFRAGLALGQCLLAEHYIRAKRYIEWYRRATDRVFGAVDLLLTPATPIPAPPLDAARVTIEGIEEPVGNALTRYTTFFNMTGHPAITLPCAMHSSGLPLGVQLIGRHFAEEIVLGAAAAIERDGGFGVPLPKGREASGDWIAANAELESKPPRHAVPHPGNSLARGVAHRRRTMQRNAAKAH